MDQLLLTLSAKFVHTKFVRSRATDAIPKYPDAKCPTLLVYRGGKVLRQYVGLEAFAGRKTDEQDVEWALSVSGAVKTEMTEPPPKADKEFKLKLNRAS
jgi:hypothetical protein